MTLDHLYRELEAARQSLCRLLLERGSNSDLVTSDPDRLARVILSTRGFKLMSLMDEERYAATEQLIQMARRYVIARDFNEFDRERALMLWKLQNA